MTCCTLIAVLLPSSILMPAGVLRLDGDDPGLRLSLSLPDLGADVPLGDARVEWDAEGRVRITRVGAVPGGVTLSVCQDLRMPAGSRRSQGGHDLQSAIVEGAGEVVEYLTITPSGTLSEDLEVARAFRLVPSRPGPVHVTWPLQNGWGRTVDVSGDGVQAEYRLCHPLTGAETPQLALPVAHVIAGGACLDVYTDPRYAALIRLREEGGSVIGELRYRYASHTVPIASPERRVFGFRLSEAAGEPAGFEDAIDSFFRLMLPDVRPGPDWLHGIAMVDYDYLSDGGHGWERDVRALAGWLTPEERGKVALCLHGWYDALGFYTYDRNRRALREEWLGFGPTQAIPLSPLDVQWKLRLARDLGFRVLLYFADGLAIDSAFPGYRDEWVYRDPGGNAIGGWQGPETFGPTYLMNPAHPEVSSFFRDYLDALLGTYGPLVDGFVWDETFHATIGQVALKPAPAYCDRAMFDLVDSLRARVESLYPGKAFLTSDCIGVNGWTHIPGCAMVAHGTYQDTHCDPAAWSYGLFPNWRNTLWSCNWSPISGYHLTRFGVEQYGVPVAISNGWGDDRGPSEWRHSERDAFLSLFRQRLAAGPRKRWLACDPADVLANSPERPAPGDPLSDARPGEVNWALAEHGSRASASSVDGYGGGDYGPAGVIDGIRDDSRWGGGGGWASEVGQPLPQWLEIDLGRSHIVTRLVAITYQHENSAETAGKWGVTDYELQALDAATSAWRTIVTERRHHAAKVRVHDLPHPIRTSRIRILVSAVAPLDGAARLLEVEAWGPSSP